LVGNGKETNMTEIRMTPVVSDTLSAVAYFEEYRDLLVRFRTGSIYVYHNVEPGLYRQMMRYNHPWHRVHAEIRDAEKHPYELVSKGVKDVTARVRKTKRPATRSVTAKVRGLQR
jgi:hypothetical protein